MDQCGVLTGQQAVDGSSFWQPYRRVAADDLDVLTQLFLRDELSQRGDASFADRDESQRCATAHGSSRQVSLAAINPRTASSAASSSTNAYHRLRPSAPPSRDSTRQVPASSNTTMSRRVSRPQEPFQ
jgi:hypothetical protein